MGGRYRIDPPGARPLVAEALEAVGWEPTDSDDWTLLWTAGEPAAKTYARLEPHQRVAHLPAIGLLARKDGLALTVERGRRLLAARGVEVARWHPETFLLPEGLPAFRARAAEEPHAHWIEKPRASARGEGVHLLADPDDVEAGGTWLVQRYLDRPHLLDGRKYTLRLYVLVTALDPLTVWVFDDGFAKLASRPFSLAPDALADRFRHLTNPGVLAGDAGTAVSADNLTLPAYADRLSADGHDPAALLARIDDLVALTLGSARDALAAAAWRMSNHPGGCFELLGLDVLVDDELRPWLVECNFDPSLAVEAGGGRAAAEERDVKRALVAETLAVAGVGGEPTGRFRAVLPDPAGRGRLLPLPRPGEAPPVALVAAPDLVTCELSDGVAVHAGGEAHVLDPLAGYVLAAALEGLAAPAIAAELVEAEPDAAWRVEADARNTLAEFHDLGLLVAAGAVEAPAVPARLPRLRWNRERVYRLLDTTLAVLVPDDELDGWLQLALGPLEDDDADALDLRAELVRTRAGWDLVWDWAPGDGGRLPVRAPRQAGTLVRALLQRRALAAGVPAFPASLLDSDDEGRVLVLGPTTLRAAYAQAWAAQGGAIAGDDLVVVGEGCALTGARLGLELGGETNWYGPLPSLGDPSPPHLAADGTFVQVVWPELRDAPPAPPGRILVVEGAVAAETPFVPQPVRETALFRVLMGSLPPGARPTAAQVIAAAALARRGGAFRAALASPAIGKTGVSLLPRLC